MTGDFRWEAVKLENFLFVKKMLKNHLNLNTSALRRGMVVFRVEVHPKVIKSAPKVLKPAHIRKFVDFLRELPENPLPEG